MNNKLSRFTFGNFFQSIIYFIFPPTEDKLRGKLIVSGAGCLEFKFTHRPTNVFVHFADEQASNPCDPGSEDLLEWHIEHVHHHHYTLVIEWDVSSVRTIVWKVCI